MCAFDIMELPKARRDALLRAEAISAAKKQKMEYDEEYIQRYIDNALSAASKQSKKSIKEDGLGRTVKTTNKDNQTIENLRYFLARERKRNERIILEQQKNLERTNTKQLLKNTKKKDQTIANLKKSLDEAKKNIEKEKKKYKAYEDEKIKRCKTKYDRLLQLVCRVAMKDSYGLSYGEIAKELEEEGWDVVAGKISPKSVIDSFLDKKPNNLV